MLRLTLTLIQNTDVYIYIICTYTVFYKIVFCFYPLQSPVSQKVPFQPFRIPRKVMRRLPMIRRLSFSPLRLHPQEIQPASHQMLLRKRLALSSSWDHSLFNDRSPLTGSCRCQNTSISRRQTLNISSAPDVEWTYDALRGTISSPSVVQVDSQLLCAQPWLVCGLTAKMPRCNFNIILVEPATAKVVGVVIWTPKWNGSDSEWHLHTATDIASY